MRHSIIPSFFLVIGSIVASWTLRFGSYGLAFCGGSIDDELVSCICLFDWRMVGGAGGGLEKGGFRVGCSGEMGK